MQIHMIWAQDKNGGIGKKGDLPWHISEDLQNFKKITLGHPVIMGLNTWISLPVKPLPRRRNIVLSPDHLDEVENYSSVETCLDALRAEGIPQVYIIGGAMIYAALYPHTDELHISIISEIVEDVDTNFPVKMTDIERAYNKVEEWRLSDVALYTRWIKK